MLDMEDLRIRFNQYNELYSNDTEFKKDVYLYTGDAYYKAGDPERAEQIYKTYLNQYTNTEVISSLMSTLLEQKKYDEMQQYLSLAQDESSVNSVSYTHLDVYKRQMVQLLILLGKE